LTAQALAATLGRWITAEVSPAPAAAVSPIVGAILDQQALASLRELGSKECHDLVKLFLKDGASRVAALREALKKGDRAAIGELAHSLKGSSGSLGAIAVADTCEQLQVAASTGDLDRATELIGVVETDFERVKAALGRELTPGPRPQEA